MKTLHLDLATLSDGLARLPESPSAEGTVELLVVRTGDGVRETPESIALSPGSGVDGDHWAQGRYSTMPELQVSLINRQVLDLIAGGARDRWALAGDNLVVDFDLSIANLPAGSRVEVGGVVLEISEKPHRGCAKFEARYGPDARTFVNLGDGPDRRLRGVYTSVVSPGTVTVGDRIAKLQT